MAEKFALVIGSSSGLGYEISQYLLEEGYIVFGGSRSGTSISHRHFLDINVDVRNEQSVEQMFTDVKVTTSGLHLIVYCAGVFGLSPIEETSSKEFSDHFATHALGAFHVFKHASDFLIENTTHIISISSLASKRGHLNTSAYSASKFALNGLIEATREEWKKHGVRFSTLVPGPINTPLWDQFEDDLPRNKMLSIEDFLNVFRMLEKSSPNVQFPEITFLHKNGFVD